MDVPVSGSTRADARAEDWVDNRANSFRSPRQFRCGPQRLSLALIQESARVLTTFRLVALHKK